MPLVNFPIDESSTHIIDVVTAQNINSVLTDVGARAFFQKENIFIDNGYTSTSRVTDVNDNIRILGDRCDVKVEIITNPQEVKWNTIINSANVSAYGIFRSTQSTLRPLFADPVSDMVITEQIVPCCLNMTFTLQFKNKEHAVRVANIITSKHHAEGTHTSSDIVFSYPLHKSVVAALYIGWKMRKTLQSQSVKFMEYLQTYFREPLESNVSKTSLATGSDPNYELLVKRHILGCVGLLSYSQTHPEPNLEDKKPISFTVEFTHTIQFGIPQHLLMNLPVVIENEFVDPELFDHFPKYNNLNVNGTFHDAAFAVMMRNLPNTYRPPLPLRIPSYDDFTPKSNYPAMNNYRPLAILNFTLDNTVTVLDLKDLGYLQIAPKALEILKRHKRDVFYSGGLFHLSVFVNDIMVNPDHLYLTDDLLLQIDCTDTTKRYHLVLSECTKLDYVDPKWADTLLEFRSYFPLQIAMNLHSLIKQRYITVEPTNSLIAHIEKFLNTGTLKRVVDTLVSEGHAGMEIYGYLCTAFQFADYISETKSLKSKRFLYDEVVDLWLEYRMITTRSAVQRLLRSRNSILIGSMAGGFYGATTPFRILDTTINSSR